jgi:hypothetical protein
MRRPFSTVPPANGQDAPRKGSRKMVSRPRFELLQKLLGSAFEVSPIHIIVGRSAIHDIMKKSLTNALGEHADFPEDLSYIVERRYKSSKAIIWFELSKLHFVQFAQTVIPAMMSKDWTPGIVIFTSDLEVACDIHSAFPMIKMSRSRIDQDADDERATILLTKALEKDPLLVMKLLLDSD